MKRSLFFLCTLFMAHQYSITQAAPVAGPISQQEVQQFIDSDDFKKLFGDMSEEEKKALAEETMRVSQELEKLPPAQRQELDRQAQALFEQQIKQIQPEKPEVPEQPTQKPIIPTKPAHPEPKKVRVDESKLVGIRNQVEELSALLEDIDLKFDSLPRVSSDNILEHKWAQISKDIPFGVAVLKATSTKNQLLEKLLSSEYTLLHNQLTTLYSELAKEHKRLIIPDAGMLSKLTDADAARAQPLTKQEKKQSKRARNTIIELLYQEIPNISFGIKGLLEKYAPEVLKESKIKMPQTRPSKVPGTIAGRGGYGDRGYSGHDNYSPYGYDQSSHPEGDNYRHGRDLSDFDRPDVTRKGSALDKDKDTTAKTDDEKTTVKKDDEKEKASETADSVNQYLKKVKTQLDELDGVVKEQIFDQKPIKETLAHLVKTHTPKTEELQRLRSTLQAVNSPLITDVKPKFDEMIKAIETQPSDLQDKSKAEILNYLKSKKHVKKLAKQAYKIVAHELQTSADEHTQIHKLLTNFITGYQNMIAQLGNQAIRTVIEHLDAANKTVQTKIIPDKKLLAEASKPDFPISSSKLKTLTQEMKQLNHVLEQAIKDRDKGVKTATKGKHARYQREVLALNILGNKTLQALAECRAAIYEAIDGINKRNQSTLPDDRKKFVVELNTYAKQFDTLINYKNGESLVGKNQVSHLKLPKSAVKDEETPTPTQDEKTPQNPAQSNEMEALRLELGNLTQEIKHANWIQGSREIRKNEDRIHKERMSRHKPETVSTGTNTD